MNRIGTTCAAGITALLLGISSGACDKMNKPFEKKSTSTVAKTPDQADYFELKKDGKTYIVGSEASRAAFTSGSMPEFKETPLDNGKSVFVENAGFENYNRLVAEYKKSKGM